MDATKKNARLAGLLYLLLTTGAFSLIYVPNRLIVKSDAVATASNVLAHETLFRTAIALDLFSSIAFIFLALALDRLLSGVDREQATLMVIFVLISVPISCVCDACNVAALAFLRTPELAMLCLRLRGAGLVVVQVFWGLWLIPFGILVMRSGFIPRILGLLLIINGFAYPIATLMAVLLPAYASVAARWLIIPETGELWIMLWLLIKGIDEKKVPALASAAA